MTKTERSTTTDVTIVLTSIAVILAILIFGSENVMWFAVGMGLYSLAKLIVPTVKSKVKEAIR